MASKGWTGTDPSAWADTASRIGTAILRNSVQELATVASTTIPKGGKVPVLTGELGRSVVVDNKPPMISEAPATGDFSAGIAAIVPGEMIYIGWTKAYARRQNNGFVGTDSLGRVYNQAGFGFAESAAAQWDAIVARQAAKLRRG